MIFDYPLTKYRLMPLLASAVVFMFGGANILRSYDEKLPQVLDPKNKVVN